MDAGKLDRLITFRRATTSYSTSNQPIKTYADAFTVWSQKLKPGGKDFYAAQKRNVELTDLYRIRYREDVEIDMQIRDGNLLFTILPPVNDEDNKHEWLTASVKGVI